MVFFDRAREFPERFLRRWREARDRQGALPLAEYAEMAGIHDWRLWTLQINLARREQPAELQDVFAARHALRLYAALAPLQRAEFRFDFVDESVGLTVTHGGIPSEASAG